MAFSMTGFGRSQSEMDMRKISVEIKTVNSKYLDLQFKIPRNFFPLENKIRDLVYSKISRGKLDLYISYSNLNPEDKKLSLDLDLASEYIKAHREVSQIIGEGSAITAREILIFKDVVNLEAKEEDVEDLWSFASPLLVQALDQLVDMRRLEGGKLVEHIKINLDGFESAFGRVIERSPDLLPEFEARINKRLGDLFENSGLEEFDPNRAAAEISFYADKISIDEEIGRLKSHIAQFKASLDTEGPVGKKLDFLVQEILRETNTIGSKANDIEITQNVVSMKNFIENIREQLQNLE